jgi:N-acetylglucosaminyldiphosphoundecaprenol N-acetyl-beta-D-mannosaminyltransferase
VAADPDATPRPTILSLAASCEVGDLESAARSVIDRATARRSGYVCLCNVHLLTVALHRADVRDALAGAWKRLPDGAPVAWIQRRLGFERASRVPGPDLMPRVVDLARGTGLRQFLFGSTPEVTERVERSLRESFPGVEVVGRHSPAFGASPYDFSGSVDVIRAADPHIVWCALGAPKQELWMHRFARELDGMVLLGVGAAFDFLARTRSRAPEWMRGAGLEWLHRLSSEPNRLAGRYVGTNTEFLARTTYELARQRIRL